MKIAINGFGRIGRICMRAMLNKPNIQVVAINDLTDTGTLAHLFKYDSIHGPFKGEISFTDDQLIINGQAINVLKQADPTALPWAELDVDVVIESTGKFILKSKAALHLQSGAKQVIISAPSPDKDVATVVLGVNDQQVDLRSKILSNASCTTNNVAPLVKVLDDNWGIIDGYITTIHSMTGDQNLHDAPHKDLRRARAASASIIPTTTGAAKAITTIFPHLEGKLGGAGIRVPVLNGSLTDFTCILKKQTTVEQINEAFKAASRGYLKGILQYTEDPIVSVDILDNPHSCIFDSKLTSIVGGLVKVVGWYDNESGYSNRLADLVEKIGELGNYIGIKFISHKDVLLLRSQILRNGKPAEQCSFATDEINGAFHLGYYISGQLVSVVSLHPQQTPSDVIGLADKGIGYQLRGMATLADHQGKGIGKQLVNYAIVYLRGKNAGYIWCNARKKAYSFYKNLAFKFISEEFEVEGIGPHKVMYLEV